MSFRELTGRWPTHPESNNPENSIYIKRDSQVFLAPTETIHAKLFALAGLPLTQERMLVDDAGEAVSVDGMLSIANYRAETVLIATFYKEHASASDMQSEFDSERIDTAGLICQLTGKVVSVQLWNGKFYPVSF